MITIKEALITGIVLRPIQLAVVTYLAIVQYPSTRQKNAYSRINKILFIVFITNIFLYGFSLFVDLVGLFKWFSQGQPELASLYLLANVLSASFVSLSLLVIYRIKIKE